VLFLKFGPEGEHVIRSIDRVSKPGCRVYRAAKDLPAALRGLGIYVLSTPRGVLSDRVARREGVGGEILCKVC
jgi:small subunit ribosomal protein S8